MLTLRSVSLLVIVTMKHLGNTWLVKPCPIGLDCMLIAIIPQSTVILGARGLPNRRGRPYIAARKHENAKINTMQADINCQLVYSENFASLVKYAKAIAARAVPIARKKPPSHSHRSRDRISRSLRE